MTTTTTVATQAFVLITHKLCGDVTVADARSFPGRTPQDYVEVFGGCDMHNKFFSEEQKAEASAYCHPRAYWEALTSEMLGNPNAVGAAPILDGDLPQTRDARPTADDAVAIASAFLDTDGGRKATDDDMTTTAIKAMTEWALGYQGDFDFLVEMSRAAFMARQHGRDLRPAQARGVLNCLLAQQKRERQDAARSGAPVTVAGTREIPDGYFTVVLTSASNHVTLRLRTARSKKYQNVAVLGARNQYTTIGGLYGTDFRFWSTTRDHEGNEYPTIQSQWARQRQALDVLLQSDDAARVAAGRAYALESGNCFRCDSPLTDPESITRSLGPTCRQYFGQ